MHPKIAWWFRSRCQTTWPRDLCNCSYLSCTLEMAMNLWHTHNIYIVNQTLQENQPQIRNVPLSDFQCGRISFASCWFQTCFPVQLYLGWLSQLKFSGEVSWSVAQCSLHQSASSLTRLAPVDRNSKVCLATCWAWSSLKSASPGFRNFRILWAIWSRSQTWVLHGLAWSCIIYHTPIGGFLK